MLTAFWSTKQIARQLGKYPFIVKIWLTQRPVCVVSGPLAFYRYEARMVPFYSFPQDSKLSAKGLSEVVSGPKNCLTDL